MGGRTRVRAAVGLWLGLALIAWLILLPRARHGLFYEVGDPLIVMGAPMLLLGVAIGASAGSALDTKPDPKVFPRRATIVGLALGAAGVVLTVTLMLWGTGIVGTPG